MRPDSSSPPSRLGQKPLKSSSQYRGCLLKMPQKIQPMDVDGAPEFMDADGAPEFEQDTDSLDADGAPEFELTGH